MPGLKLTMAASIYGNPYKWVRTIANPPPPMTPKTKPPFPSSSHSFALNSNNAERISVGWRITPCAQSAHHKDRSLGFGGHKSFSSSSSSFYTPPKSRSEDKGEGRGSSGPPLTDNIIMGAEHHDDDDWSQNHYQRQQQQQQQLQQQPPLSQPLLQQQQPPLHQHQQPFKLLTLPTILTLGRVAAVPFLVSTFYVDSWWGTTATTSIFIAAAITDWLDGYIARKMRLGTAFGAFLDPVADKLMVAATLVLLCSRPLHFDTFCQLPWLLTVPSIAIIGREITMSAVREWAASEDSKLLEAVAVNNLGKWKTATQMTALTILLATRDSSLAGPGVLVSSGVALLYISAGLAVWSLVVYMRKIWKVLLK